MRQESGPIIDRKIRLGELLNEPYAGLKKTTATGDEIGQEFYRGGIIATEAEYLRECLTNIPPSVLPDRNHVWIALQEIRDITAHHEFPISASSVISHALSQLHPQLELAKLDVTTKYAQGSYGIQLTNEYKSYMKLLLSESALRQVYIELNSPKSWT